MGDEQRKLFDELSAVTEELMDCLNDLDVGALEYLKDVCDMLIASKAWND